MEGEDSNANTIREYKKIKKMVGGGEESKRINRDRL
jgi:hypothetical protein